MERAKITIKGWDYSRIQKGQVVGDREVALAFLLDMEEKEKKGENRKRFPVNTNPHTHRTGDFHFIGKDGDYSSTTAYIGLENKPLSQLRFDGIVGTLRYPHFKHKEREYDVTVEIRSRLDSGDNAYFLARLLQSSPEMMHLADTDIPATYEELFEFLKICVFRQRLLKAWETGFYKKYTYFQENTSRLRGRIDVARHIRLNAALDNGKIACEYRENTLDNPVNHLILKTWLALRRAHPDHAAAILTREDASGLSAEKVLRQLQFQAPGYEKESLSATLRKSAIPVTNPYFQEYEPLRRVCIDILNGLNYALYDGRENSGEDVQSMLFYIPGLWEVYLQQHLETRLPQYGFGFQQKARLFPGGPNRYPDTVSQNGKIVLDAKFKPNWSPDKYPEDMTQVYAYGYLFGASVVGILHPKKGGGSDVTVQQVGKREDAWFLEGKLAVPDSTGPTRQEWLSSMKKEEKNFFDKLADKLAAALSSEP